MSKREWWESEFDDLVYEELLAYGWEPFILLVKQAVCQVLSQARLKERDRIVKWLIKQELPEVTCHQNHRDLVAGYNQALLKVRRYILAQLKTKKK